MKTVYKLALILILSVSYTCTGERYVSAQGEGGYVSFQVFYDQLSPYGEWIDYPNYGYVWIPDVGYDFEPYSTAGYWVMTDYGWTWVSEYPWGWAPFHYGRWDFDRRIGWMWIPGNEWGPAWVTWRRANGYYGWAPLRPGISVSMSFNLGYRDDDHWCFVRDRDFGRRDIYRYYVDRRDYDPIARNSVVINNTYMDNRRNITYISGPRRDEIQRYTGRRIKSMPVRDEIRPGQTSSDNQLRIYRPRIESAGRTGSRPAPSRLSNIDNIKPREERNAAPDRNIIIPQNNDRREERQAVPQRQTERRNRDFTPQQTDPQRRYEPQRGDQPNQPNMPPQRRYEPGPGRNDQPNIQRQERSQQMQQNQQSTPQQRREMRRTERSQRRMQIQQQQPQQQQQQRQQQSNPSQQQAVPQSSDQNNAGQQQNDQGTTGSGRRR